MDKSVKDKLDSILNLDVNNGTEKLTSEQLDRFESQYGVTVPDEYREFLINYYSCYVREDLYHTMLERSSLTPKDGMEQVDYFYNTEFIKGAEIFISAYGKKVLPIGRTGGDYICIGVQKDDLNKIYHLYHEDREREDGLYLAADSFNGFILGFEYRKPERQFESGKIKLHLSPELMESLEKYRRNKNDTKAEEK